VSVGGGWFGREGLDGFYAGYTRGNEALEGVSILNVMI